MEVGSIRKLIFPLLLFLFCFISISLLFPRTSPYDYYERLANAFLTGRLCLQDNPPWLNELISIPDVGYCVVYPITPALLIIPIAFLQSPFFTQTTLSHLIFASCAIVICLYWKKQKKSPFASLSLADSSELAAGCGRPLTVTVTRG